MCIRDRVDEVLQAENHGPNARTEELQGVELQKLCEAFRQQLIKVTGEERPKLANQGN